MITLIAIAIPLCHYFSDDGEAGAPDHLGPSQATPRDANLRPSIQKSGPRSLRALSTKSAALGPESRAPSGGSRSSARRSPTWAGRPSARRPARAHCGSVSRCSDPPRIPVISDFEPLTLVCLSEFHFSFLAQFWPSHVLAT